MRKLSLLPLFLLLAAAPGAAAAVSTGHSGWQWGNPQPQGNSLQTIDFEGGTGYAAGSFGTVLKTTDSGVNWTGLSSGTTASLSRIRALDADVVFAGGGCVLRRSDDGGATFRRVAALASERSCRASVRSFSFVDGQTGYVLLSDGTVQRTADGGTSFGSRAALPGSAAAGGSPALTPTDIWFTSESTGYALAGGNVLRTTDGASNWTQVFSGSAALNSLHFEGDTGYAAGDGKTVLRTTNGGTSWTAREVDAEVPAGDLSRVDCANANRCLFATKQGDQLVRTANGGGSFTSVRPSGSKIAAAAFNGNQAAVAVGEAGTTALSANGGSDWTPVGQALTGALIRLRSTPGGLFATGEDGALLRSTNGGEDWSKPNVSTSEDVVDATFPSDSAGYALDAAGDVRKTVDGASNWTPVTTGVRGKPRSIFAPTPSTLVLIGPKGIARSADGGGTFRRVSGGEALRRSVLSSYDRAGSGLFLYGSRALFSAGIDASGLRRVRRPGSRRAQIASADFLTARTGYVLNANGRLWKTTTRGRRWSEMRATGTRGAYAMAWGDALNGYLAVRRVGSARRAGYVLRTSDGGRSWRPQLVAPSTLRRGGLVATASQTAFSLADGNQLFHTTSGGDLGAQTTLTLRSTPARFRRPRRVTIAGTLAPAVAGAAVHVSVRSAAGGRWTVRRAVTSSAGTFSVRVRLRRSSVAVAQWLGEPGRAGDGSGVLAIRRVR